ncbi:hypothetical protein [Methylobacterium nodulans]|uniref:Uncharacterized protein n=1 Tax=Methylobacterium nodulans (strain LMG 21967 / CNCM I-2342 / ORS 2060) TaxID=460265 RepID=B8IGP0_METNO|nr:hypothetical protein [Methylobacterium nodulans]ACL55940.1 hypothetical protein Mnod_0921 [Methylobacterium nodulans ORS 2060]
MRKAYDLVRVAETFQNLGVDSERLERTGWTKLRLIASEITKSTVRMY